MRKPISIAIVALVAVATFWTWTLTHNGANARSKLSSAAPQQINTLDLTMKAGALPVQSFDAH